MPKLQDPTPISRDSPTREKDHIHVANRLLLLAAEVGWSGLKLIVKTAIRIPRLFIRPNDRDNNRPPSQH